MAPWCSRLARQPVTLEVDGSSPFGVATAYADNNIPTRSSSASSYISWASLCN